MLIESDEVFIIPTGRQSPVSPRHCPPASSLSTNLRTTIKPTPLLIIAELLYELNLSMVLEYNVGGTRYKINKLYLLVKI